MPEESKAAPAPVAPAPAQSAPASTSSGGKGGGSKLIIIIVIIVVVLGAAGYFARNYLVKKAAEKTAESILSTATGGKVSVDSSDNGGVTINSNGSTLSTGSKSSWPATMPTSVPEFKYGTISSSSTSNDSTYKAWSAGYTDITSDALTKYDTQLLANSWTQTYSADADTNSTRMYDSTSYSLSVIVDSAGKTATISVTAK